MIERNRGMSNRRDRTEPSLDDHVLQRLLTPERLHSYLDATHNDVSQALRLYEWNIDAPGVVMGITGMVEVIVRNALDFELSDWASAHGHDDWFDAAPLDDRGRHDVDRARHRARHEPPRHGKVIAELSFGFWRYLVAQRYHTSLWVPALHRAFPNGHHDIRRRRDQVEQCLKQLLFVRNRAAHHEPIHRRDIRHDLNSAAEVAGWVDSDAGRWVTTRADLAEIIERKPASN